MAESPLLPGGLADDGVPPGAAFALAEAIQGLSASLAGRRNMEEAFGLDAGGATQTEEEYSGLWGGDGGGAGGSGGFTGKASGSMTLERVRRTRESRPDTVIAAHERRARRDMPVLLGDSWSWDRHARERLIEHAPRFKTLRRMAIAVAAGLDTGRVGSYEEMAAYFHQLYRVLEAAAKDGGAHDLAWGWPVLGVPDPDEPRGQPGWSPAEAVALNAFHREQHALHQVRRSWQQQQQPPGAASSSSGGGTGAAGAAGGARGARGNWGKTVGAAPAEKAAPRGGKGRGKGAGAEGAAQS